MNRLFLKWMNFLHFVYLKHKNVIFLPGFLMSLCLVSSVIPENCSGEQKHCSEASFFPLEFLFVWNAGAGPSPQSGDRTFPSQTRTLHSITHYCSKMIFLLIWKVETQTTEVHIFSLICAVWAMYIRLFLNPHSCQCHFTKKTKAVPWWLYNTQCPTFFFGLCPLPAPGYFNEAPLEGD